MGVCKCYYGFMVAHYRMKSALLTDRRVKIMSEVISGMRVIKMYAWEHAFKRVVGTIRRLEISVSKNHSHVH